MTTHLLNKDFLIAAAVMHSFRARLDASNASAAPLISQDFVTEGGPDDYYTVLGYFAEFDPEKFAEWETVEEAMLYSMEVSLWIETEIEHSDDYRVVAPMQLFERGITDIKAYPLATFHRWLVR